MVYPALGSLVTAFLVNQWLFPFSGVPLRQLGHGCPCPWLFFSSRFLAPIFENRQCHGQGRLGGSHTAGSAPCAPHSSVRSVRSPKMWASLEAEMPTPHQRLPLTRGKRRRVREKGLPRDLNGSSEQVRLERGSTQQKSLSRRFLSLQADFEPTLGLFGRKVRHPRHPLQKLLNCKPHRV